MTNYETLQIIPAVDWFAVYGEGDREARYPLICWALVRDANGAGPLDKYVVGLDTDDAGVTEVASEASNFLRYEHGYGAKKLRPKS